MIDVYNNIYYLKEIKYNLKKGFMNCCICNSVTYDMSTIRIEKIKAISWKSYKVLQTDYVEGVSICCYEDTYILSFDINKIKLVIEDFEIANKRYLDCRSKIKCDSWVDSVARVVFNISLDFQEFACIVQSENIYIDGKKLKANNSNKIENEDIKPINLWKNNMSEEKYTVNKIVKLLNYDVWNECLSIMLDNNEKIEITNIEDSFITGRKTEAVKLTDICVRDKKKNNGSKIDYAYNIKIFFGENLEILIRGNQVKMATVENGTAVNEVKTYNYDLNGNETS